MNDRQALEYLMGQFDSEICVCERCGHEEATKDFDSAIFLREYLSGNRRTPEPATTQPLCPECNNPVLFACVACSATNYPPATTHPDECAALMRRRAELAEERLAACEALLRDAVVCVYAEASWDANLSEQDLAYRIDEYFRSIR